MTALFWAIEYVKVLLAYAIIFFVWPSLVFRKFLNGKSTTFRITFCVTGQFVLVNTVVLMIGLVHCLNAWVIRVLFYGPILYGIVRAVLSKKDLGKQIKRVSTGTYGFKNCIWRIAGGIRDKFRAFWKKVRLEFSGKLWDRGLLLIIIVFGMIYFTYGAFCDYSYGFGDMYPHNAWIYGLTQGKIFSAGVYPEGMHCMLYAMHTLFGIRIYSCLLFFQGIHVCMFLIAAYLLLREMFVWRYTPFLALGLFLTIDMLCINSVYGMSRLQWTLPQETSLFTVFLCAAFLIRYLKSDKSDKALFETALEAVSDIPTIGADAADEESDTKDAKSDKIKIGRLQIRKPRFRMLKKIIADENLLIFSLSIAVSLSMHFYCTIMAFLLCVAVIPVTLTKVFRPKNFLLLVVAVIWGTVVAVVPMAGALASGIPFQGSIGWAMNVMNGTDGEGGGNIILDENGEEITGGLFGFGSSSSSSGSSGSSDISDASEDGSAGFDGETQKKPKLSLKQAIRTIYLEAYVTLFRMQRADILILMTLIAFGIFIAFRLFLTLRKLLVKQKKVDAARYDHYFSLIFAGVLFMTLYSAEGLGLPALVQQVRLCSVIDILLAALCFIPIDAAMSVIGRFLHRNINKLLGFAMLAGIYIATRLTGTFHGYLYYELTRYNAAVMTTYKITEELPKYSYTIVSTVDELYQQIQYGFHEEAVNFINECIEDEYTIPSEYVFIYIEKRPLEYAQSHFFTGPSWLAEEKYTKYYSSFVSQCPEISVGAISDDLAQPPFFSYPVSSSAYSSLGSRMVLESRLNSWCQEFSELYPGELHTYYEDDDFVCYYFKQNPACLYQLGFRSEEKKK